MNLIFHSTVLNKNKEYFNMHITPYAEIKKLNSKLYLVVQEEAYWKVFNSNYRSILNYKIKTEDNRTIFNTISTSQWLRLNSEIPQFKHQQEKGIYGIYFKDELVYIGNTSKSFEDRFSQHLSSLSCGSQHLYVYLRELNAKPEELSIKPLYISNDDRVNTYGLSCIELAFINFFQPKGNLAGRTQPYQFSEYAHKSLKPDEQEAFIKAIQEDLGYIIKKYLQS